MRDLKYFIPPLLFLAFATVAVAAPYYTLHNSLLPLDSSENIGTSSSRWAEGHFVQLCLSSDCKTAWPTGADGTFSTTSADWWDSLKNRFGTTSISATSPLNWNTTTATLTIDVSGDWTGTLDGFEGFGYLFPSNATSTLLNFNDGLTSYASTTIGNGTAKTGLTISGNATTTGNIYIVGMLGVGTNNPQTSFHLSADSGGNIRLQRTNPSFPAIWDFVPSQTQAGDLAFMDRLSNANRLTILANGNLGLGSTTPYARLSVEGGGVFNRDVRADFFTATSTTVASTFPLASITKLSNLTSNGFVKTSSGDGTLSVDTSTYESGLTAGDGLTRTADDFDCDTASGSVFGCLSSSDWTTFNNKLSSLIGSTGQVAYFSGSNSAVGTSSIQIATDQNIIIPAGIATSTSGAANKAFLARKQDVFSTTTVGTNVQIIFTGAVDKDCSFASAVLTCPSNTAYFEVEIWGGGGGGAGGGTAASSYNGGGGQGGSYSYKLVNPLTTTTYYYTVGAGGAGGADGATGGSPGTAGSESCFGTNSTACTTPLAQANGGRGGPGSGEAGIANSGGTAGDITIAGGLGGGTLNYPDGTASPFAGGSSGGAGARGGAGGPGGGTGYPSPSTNGYGVAATGLAGGGGGGGNKNGGGSIGGAGAPGGFMITVFAY